MNQRRAKIRALERQLKEMFRRLGETAPAHLADTLDRLEPPRPAGVETA